MYLQCIRIRERHEVFVEIVDLHYGYDKEQRRRQQLDEQVRRVVRL